MSDDAPMPDVTLPGVTIAYDVFGPSTGEPVVFVCGLSQPAVAWQLTLVPALTEAGYRVVTFDNRGVAPSSSPAAPYTIDEMVEDTPTRDSRSPPVSKKES